MTRSGLVLRREGVYSSQVSKWRHQVCEGAGSEKKRGPKKRSHADMAQEIKRLRQQVASYERKTAKYELIIDVQKKMSQLMNSPLASDDESEQN